MKPQKEEAPGSDTGGDAKDKDKGIIQRAEPEINA